MKKVLSVLLAAILCFTLAACQSASPSDGDVSPGGAASPGGGDASPGGAEKPGDLENVTLTLWGGEEDQVMLRSMADEFIEAHKGEVSLTINIGVESESTAKDTILTDIEAAADVFAFADDQISDLYAAGALQEIVLNTEAIIAANGPAAVTAATVNGKLYAYPMTADNGYFMYYDASFFTVDDVKSFDKMMEVAAAAGKQITMDFGSGWYTNAFFTGAGLKVGLNPDGTNYCDWNTGKGPAVVQAMLDIATNPGFISLGDGEFVTGIKDGSIIAGINGPWNASTASDVWGANYAAAKLPTFTLDGQQTQMHSFCGSKLVGINAFSANVGWAMKLGEWITNYDNQVRRFNERKQGPSNIQAGAIEAVQADPAQAAIAAQAPFAAPTRLGGNYWAPTSTLGEIISQGNPDGTDLQTLLDNVVAGVTAP